jgi:hypothetical protein
LTLKAAFQKEQKAWDKEHKGVKKGGIKSEDEDDGEEKVNMEDESD